ncbi:MAG: hypothetical protein AAEC86_11735, partial [Pseudohongiellaceae bacterium]
GETCLTHYLWEDLSNQIHNFLEDISLADLVAKSEIKLIAAKQDRQRMVVTENIREIGEANDLRIAHSSL